MSLRMGLLAVLWMLPAATDASAEIVVRGQLQRPDGAALKGAEVLLVPYLQAHEIARQQLVGQTESQPVASTRSDADGRFELKAPELGMWKVVVRHDEVLPLAFYLRPLLYPIELPPVAPPRRQQRRVTIVDAAGEPVPGLRLAARGWSEGWQRLRQDSWWPDTRWLVTDADGVATIPVDNGETCSIAVVTADHFLFRQLPPGTEEMTVALAPLRPATIVDASERPAAGVFAAIRWPFVAVGKSDGKGTVLIPPDPGQKGGYALALADERAVYDRLKIEHRGAGEDGEGEDGAGEEQLVFRLPAVERVDGQVIDAASKTPLADALVWSMGASLYRTDRGGSFTAWLPVLPYRSGLRAAAAGYLETAVEFSEIGRLPGEPVTLALEAQVVHFGRVVDGTGEGLAAAEVRADPSAAFAGDMRNQVYGLSPVTLRADADGSFELGRLAAGIAYVVSARHPGYADARILVPPLQPGQAAEEVVLTLVPGIVAVGTVRDVDERPIAGAEVVLRPEGESLPTLQGDERLWRASADGEGRFEIRDLGPGPHALSASAAGFSQLTVPGLEIEAQAEPFDLGVVFLEPGLRLSGRVVDRQGRGIVKAQVSLRSSQHTRQRRLDNLRLTEETSADGFFAFAGLPRTASVMVQVYHQEYQPFWLNNVTVDSAEPLQIVLERGVTVTGQVVGRRGEPAARAEVILQRQVTGDTSGSSRPADHEGRFFFRGLAPGRATVMARSAEGVSAPLEIDLAIGGEEEAIGELRLVLEPAARIRGQLVDPDGVGVAAAQVRLLPAAPGGRIEDFEFARHQQSVVADGSGRFAIGGLEPGAYQVTASHAHFGELSEAFELVAGEERQLRLAFDKRRGEQGLRVSGRVVSATGAGVIGARVRLEGSSLLGNTPQTVTLGDGQFDLEVPTAGTYTLTADHPDYAPRRSEPFTVDEAAGDALLIELSSGGTVRGRVVGLELEQLSRLEVQANGNFAESRTGIVSYDGTYRIEHLGTGTWRIAASLDGYRRSAEKTATVAGDGDEVTVDLSFEAGHRLAGKVLLNGEPLAAAQLWLNCSSPYLWAAENSRSDGTFVFRDVPTASCHLSASDRSSQVNSQRVIQMDGDSEVILELFSVVLSAQVQRRDDLQAIAGATVQLITQGAGGSALGRTGPDGSLRLTISAGSYEMRATADGFAAARQMIDIEAGRENIVQLLLEPATPLSVVVKTADGRVPSQVTVHLIAEGDGQTRTETYRPGPDGQIVLRTLHPGAWKLVFFSQEGGMAEISVEVPSEPLQVVLTTAAAPTAQ